MAAKARTIVQPRKGTLVSLLLAGRQPSGAALVDSINSGIASSSVDELLAYGLTIDEIAGVVGVSVRTLRRKRAARAKLNVAETDRLIRLAQIAAMAEQMIGSREKALAWLRTPNWAMSDKVPLELTAAEPGAQLVRQSLVAIGYGGVA